MAAANPIEINFSLGDEITLPGSVLEGVAGFRFFPKSNGVPDSGLLGSENRINIRAGVPFPIRDESNPLVIGFGTDTASVRRHGSDTALQAALNDLGDMITAGRCDVEEITRGLFEIRFRENGARALITAVHPALGSLARVSTIQTGDGSTKAIQRVDLRIDRLAQIDNAAITAVSAGSVSAAITAAGTATLAQVETISFTDPLPVGGNLGISDDAGTSVEQIPLPATGYQVQQALERLTADQFRAQVNDETWIIQRRAEGVQANALTVYSGGVVWPEGVECEIDFAPIRRILERFLRAPGNDVRHAPIIIEFISGDDVSDSAAERRTVLTIHAALNLRGPSVAEPTAIA